MVSHSQEPYHTGDDKAHHRAPLQRETVSRHPPVDHSPEDARDCIDLLMEDDRFVVEQHIADDPTGRTRDTSHDNRHPIRLSEEDTLLDTRDGEECQSEGVEDEPCVFQWFHPFSEEGHRQQCDSRTYHIYRCRHPERSGSQHHVTDRTTSDGYGNATDIPAKPVEVFGSRMTDARYTYNHRDSPVLSSVV